VITVLGVAGILVARSLSSNDDPSPPARIATATAPIFSTTSPPNADGRSDDLLPTYEIRLTPNYLQPSDDPSDDFQAVWLYPKSPTTPYRSPDSFKQQTRYLLLDPRYTDADGRRGHDEWWFIIERNWPASYQSANHGEWGASANFHNVAGDAGSAENGDGGVGTGFGDKVSALALAWLPGRPAPTINVEPQSDARNMLLPVPTRDAWHTYVIHWIAGRTDGSTPRPGAITVWADGNVKPVIDRSNINTVSRAEGQDGRSYTQRWMVLWEGDYTRALPIPATTRYVLTRIGKTLAEALADRPVPAGASLAGQYYGGSGPDYGPPTIKQTQPRTAVESRIPPDIGADASR
jgi:hypothetical protein